MVRKPLALKLMSGTSILATSASAQAARHVTCGGEPRPAFLAQAPAGIPDSVVPIPYPSSGRKYKQEIMKAFVQRATALPEIGSGKADSDRQLDAG